jgi:uncharacterized membrane protein
MEGIVILFIFFLIWLLIAPIVALVKASDARRKSEEAGEEVLNLSKRIRALEAELSSLKTKPEPAPTRIPEPRAATAPPPEPKPEPEPAVGPRPSFVEHTPPPLPAPLVVQQAVARTAKPPAAVAPESDAPPHEPFSLERFMGVKLFAWLGGVAMFFGVIFFVKYAFENNLIPPAVRIALGFISGTALLAGGFFIHRNPRYQVLAQAFCATGVLILYGVSFAAHAIYHFAAFGPVSTFVLMALITLVAFLIAVRLNALVVAVLGMLGGFLTPVLLSTGHDNVFGLFGYIALLDIGLIAVARHANWRYLTAAAAAGTAMIQVGWYEQYFQSGRYFEGPSILIPMAILLGFIGLFLTGEILSARTKRPDPPADRPLFAAGSVLGLAAVAMAFAFAMLGQPLVAERHFLLYGFLLLLNLAVITQAFMLPRWSSAQIVLAALTFLHLAIWTDGRLTAENLMAAMALYLVFGALHAVLPLLLAKRIPAHIPEEAPPETDEVDLTSLPLRMAPWMTPVILLLMLMALSQLDPVPLGVWAGILLANLLAIGLAVLVRTVMPVLLALALTLFIAGQWLFKLPSVEASLLPFLGVVSGFSLLFTFAGRLLFRGIPTKDDDEFTARFSAAILPVASALLPFILLVMAVSRLPVANPSPVFGTALLMVVLLGGLTVIARQGPLMLAALPATLAVEFAWHRHHFDAAAPVTALVWYLLFYLLFLAFPFIFRRKLSGQASPWIASALAGVGHFLLVHDLVKQAYPNSMMGLIPAAFAVPSLLALVAVIRMAPAMESTRRSQLAWFGGVALLFITLVFPIQFDRQWLTVSWAIEGALLVWLFRRVAHPGLLLTGLSLLAISFVRLTVNPAVFTAYPRSGTAILNWHLYTYGLVAIAMFAAAHWFKDPGPQFGIRRARGILQALGGILLFLLLNIQIADFFTSPGERFIAFRFGGNFARDMTYSIAWGLFALALLVLGIWKHSPHARFAAIGLLVLTLIKVFIHDLAAIENVFRIGALVGVAIIAFIASFLYQRFFDRKEPREP